MGCSSSGYKVCLVCSNVTLLFIGVAILILGIKMKFLLQVVLLTDLPIIAVAIKAVVATGTFISFAGITGIAGACYEAKWLITVHLLSLGTIVIMQIGLGVTILFVKKAIESYVGTTDCDKDCATTLDVIVLDYALPSAGLMMTIIIVEALMMYSAIRLYLHIRDTPKIPPSETFVIESVQMRDVASPLPSYVLSSHNPQIYTPQMNYMHQAPPGFLHHSAPPRYIQRSPNQSPSYSRLPLDMQEPPSYVEASGQIPKMDTITRPASLNSV